ncbi:outer membrane protein [Paraburkholderia dilworthii]|uniref:outer membrane protein n=1 Tax=Paraburkholderia dilworthii TaxID=948106 RepID=UPI000685F02A|nr:hypothetical protein [Paraburkholderia dilworthii]
MDRAKLPVIVSAFIAAAPVLSNAQTSRDAWQFEATPYLWAAGFSGWGRVGARTPTANLDASFSNVWRNLDFGAMGSFEARKGRWAIIFDTIYVKLSKTSDPLLGGALGTAKLKGDQTIAQLAGAYRLVDSRITPVDALVGVRYTNLYSQISFSPSRLLPGGVSRSDSVDWTDGFVGARAAYLFTDRWSVVGYADVGAGGSRLSWQLLAGAEYRFSKTISAKAGYRVLSMNYEKPDFLYDVRTAGFYMGLGIRF